MSKIDAQDIPEAETYFARSERERENGKSVRAREAGAAPLFRYQTIENSNREISATCFP